MSSAPIRDQTLALAGLFQALALVQRVARDGRVDAPEALECSLCSLLALDAADTESVYGGKQGLRIGVGTLSRQFDATRNAEDDQLTRYAAGLLYLERRFARSPAAQAEVGTRLNEIAILRNDYVSVPAQGQTPADWISSDVISRFADIYMSLVSPLGPKILIRGEPIYLQLAANTDLIRALLLAALRSVVLWRQLGGNRWQMMFSRRRIQRVLWTLAD